MGGLQRVDVRPEDPAGREDWGVVPASSRRPGEGGPPHVAGQLADSLWASV